MKVVVVRHGEAEGYRSPDAERRLTPRGREQALRTGTWLRETLGEEVKAARLLASPYCRALETAEAISECLGVALAVRGELTPDEDPRRAFGVVDACHAGGVEVVILVSHMPLAAAFVSWMEEGVLGAGLPFALAEARLLELPEAMPGVARRTAAFQPDLA